MKNALRKLLREPVLADLMVGLLEDVEGAAILDEAGTVLTGAVHSPATNCRELSFDGEVAGWLTGGAGAERLAGVLQYALDREAEKRALAHDALDRYRELTLLYDLSEHLNRALDTTSLARVAVSEARRRIHQGFGFALLLGEDGETLSPIAAEDEDGMLDLRRGEGLLGAVVAANHPEIVNDLAADARPAQAEALFRSLVCAPLEARGAAIGVLAVGSRDEASYTAADLKLLCAVAAATGPRIEAALTHERALRAAEERERDLRRQLDELRIQVDETRQARQVAAITGTEYFRRLRDQAIGLRREFDLPV